MKYLICFLREASLIKCISKHRCHVTEHGTIFLMSIRESKHTSKIHLYLMEIGVQTVTTNRSIIQILVCGLHDLGDLLVGCCLRHNCKYL